MKEPGPNMDELIARLECAAEFMRDAEADDDADLVEEAATALRASAERERELREALEQIELLHYGDNTFHDDAVKAHLIAREALNKTSRP